MDCLVIASKFRPLPILEKAMEHLGSNRYFVVYSATQEVGPFPSPFETAHSSHCVLMCFVNVPCNIG